MGRVNQGGVLAEVILEWVPVEKSRDVEGRERWQPSEQVQARCRARCTELPKRSGRWSPAPFPLLPKPLTSSVAVSTCSVSVLFSVPPLEEVFPSPLCSLASVRLYIYRQTKNDSNTETHTRMLQRFQKSCDCLEWLPQQMNFSEWGALVPPAPQGGLLSPPAHVFLWPTPSEKHAGHQ